ncbi:hypothetical protein THRCLA_21503 [Thraustotheca clavata]|uniref:RING-type domain-containing protein n=1 Tax=Thraustotheca clavata TaxID=74557 RepID=A0A1V9ZVS6_9STRA|nr:hypothetical protein THRCLA_21503 [Thraustotheca clavata]
MATKSYLQETLLRRADIRRATSLRDLVVRVFPLETDLPFGWGTQYEVALENRQHDLFWKFFCTYGEMKRYMKQVGRIAKGSKCPNLLEMGKQIKKIVFRAIFREKAPIILELLNVLFTLLSTHAVKVAHCRWYRQVLHTTQEFCALEYPMDQHALLKLESMTTMPLDMAKTFEEDCCICLSAEDDVMEYPHRVALKCGHVFHETCICMWYNTRLNCPICRQ